MEKTDEQLAKVIEKALQTATNTGDFIIEQAPDLIQQLILYKTIEKSVMVIIFSFILYFSIKAIKKEIKKDNDFDIFFTSNPFIVVFSSISIIFFGISLLIIIPDLIKLIFAPKIYLIEYVSNLVK